MLPGVQGSRWVSSSWDWGATRTGSRFSWWITIENLTDEPKAIDVTLLFGDGQGGRLYESPKHPIELRPREKGTVTGSALIASDVAARIYGAGYIVSGR